MATKKLNRVVVWTKSRPWLVAMGELVSRKGDEVVLRNARCAVYFDAETRSVLGLGSHGPGSASRISRKCDEVGLCGVEGVASASPAAVKAWESEPWQ